MGAKKSRTLGAALAISLALHLILASVVHVRPVQAIPYHVTRVIIHIYVHPKPTPRPPQPPPRVHSVAHHNIETVRPQARRPHVPSRPTGVVAVASSPSTGVPPAPGNTGTRGDGAIGQPPESTEPPAPACSEPNVEARTLSAVSPDGTAGGVDAGSSATAMIKVDLDATGRVTGVSVYRSTGSFELDRAATEAARESTYAPEVRDCQPVSGSYLFKVEFSN